MAIKSGHKSEIQEFQNNCQLNINDVNKSISELCKKRYTDFLQALKCMKEFKSGLGEVKERLGDISQGLAVVDSNFFVKAD